MILFSRAESENLNFKIARYNVAKEMDLEHLKKEIVANDYDLCRVKLPAEDEMISNKLNTLGFPFFFSGSIRRYDTLIKENYSGVFLNPSLEFIEYDYSKKHQQLLFEMMKDTWGSYPIGYYRTPYICHLVNKAQEIKSVFEFYKNQNNPLENPQNTFMFMKDKGVYVGFFALNHVDGNLESHIGGILKPYQKGGYFLDMLHFIKLYCLENKLPRFLFGARNENALVQKIFQQVGFQPIGTENVFHLTSMLSHQTKSYAFKQVFPHSFSFMNFINDFLLKSIKPLALQSIHCVNNTNEIKKLSTIQIALHNEKILLVVGKTHNLIVYLTYKL